VVNEFKRTDINFVIGDCFDETIFKEIADGIQQEGKTLLICDGGFKTREFKVRKRKKSLLNLKSN
jgi:hypothetical protein